MVQTAGTINVGTVDAISQLPPNLWGTTVNSGTNTLQTLKAGIGGSTIYITDLTISMTAGGTVAIYSGGTAAPIAGTWTFNANGGIVQNYRSPIFAATGSAIVYQQVGTSLMSISASGFIK